MTIPIATVENERVIDWAKNPIAHKQFSDGGFEVVQGPALVLTPCDAVAKGPSRFNENLYFREPMLNRLVLSDGSTELIALF
jgi:hypothetical protein